MEFHERLQKLRKEKGLTQEELAAELFVSRAAVSKWESGRGYPGIDSLKAIASYFTVSIDTLLSTGEALTIAEEDAAQKKAHFTDLMFGCLDCCFALFFFLPLFGQNTDGTIQNVSVSALTALHPWLKTGFLLSVITMLTLGVLTFALQRSEKTLWHNYKRKLSLICNATVTFLFISCRQPYAASLSLIFFMIKVLILSKNR